MAQTQEFIEALKEADKVAFIKTLIAGLAPADRAKLDHLILTKDVNVDILDDNQKVLFNRIFGLSHLTGTAGSTDENLKTDHLSIAEPIRIEGTQVIPTDKGKALGSKELITIGNAIAHIDLLHATLTNHGASTPLLADGSVQMETGYLPQNPLDVATQESVEIVLSNAGSGSSGGIAYKPSTAYKAGTIVTVGDKGFVALNDIKGSAPLEVLNPPTVIPAVPGDVIIVLDTSNPKYATTPFGVSWDKTTATNKLYFHSLAANGRPEQWMEYTESISKTDTIGSIDNHKIKPYNTATNGVPVEGKPEITITEKHDFVNWKEITLDINSLVHTPLTGTNKLATLVDIPHHLAYLKTDGSRPMESTYVPKHPFDVVTKDYVDEGRFVHHGNVPPKATLGKDGDIYFEYGTVLSSPLNSHTFQKITSGGTLGGGSNGGILAATDYVSINPRSVKNPPSKGDRVNQYIEVKDNNGVIIPIPDTVIFSSPSNMGDLLIEPASLMPSNIMALSQGTITYLHEGTGTYDIYEKHNGVWAEENDLKADGTVPMDAGYEPTHDQDVATKKFVVKIAGRSHVDTHVGSTHLLKTLDDVADHIAANPYAKTRYLFEDGTYIGAKHIVFSNSEIAFDSVSHDASKVIIKLPKFSMLDGETIVDKVTLYIPDIAYGFDCRNSRLTLAEGSKVIGAEHQAYATYINNTKITCSKTTIEFYNIFLYCLGGSVISFSDTNSISLIGTVALNDPKAYAYVFYLGDSSVFFPTQKKALTVGIKAGDLTVTAPEVCLFYIAGMCHVNVAQPFKYDIHLNNNFNLFATDTVAKINGIFDSKLIHVGALANPVNTLNGVFSNGSNIIDGAFPKPAGKELVTEDDVNGLIAKVIPTLPTADGDYKLHIASGVATWITV